MTRLRVKETGDTGVSLGFNTASLSEVVVGFDGMDCDSVYMRDLDVEIDGEWKDLRQALKDKDLVPDNYNTRFGPPTSEENRERGYND